MAQALKRRQPIRGMEAVAERPDGTRISFIPYPTPLFDGSGDLVGAVNMLVDISEHKRTEVALAKHKDEQTALYRFTDRLYRAGSTSDTYEAALDAIGDSLSCRRASILLLDEAGVMRFVGWRGLSDGYRRSVEGHSPWTKDTKDPEPICIADVHSSDMSEALKNTVKAENIAALAFIPLMANGEFIGKFMTYYDEPHIFTDAEVQLAVTIARQLGFGIERMRVDEARRRSEQAARLLSSIVGTSDDAIVSKDLNSIVTSWNRGAERLFGYSADEIIGKPITILIPSDRLHEEPQILERIKRGEQVDHYESVRVRKDGSFVDISLTVSPIMDAKGKIVGASKIARDISESKKARARQELLTQEINHRTKNLFAVVHSIVSRSLTGKQTVEDARTATLSRLHALAHAHAMLLDKDWQGADITDVVRSELGPYSDRVTIDGPSLVLTAKAAQNFALALHELATNAVKYGALSNTSGRIAVTWRVNRQTDRFTFEWQERGGPPAVVTDRKGFGSAVLEQVMAEYFVRPRIEFFPEGICYQLNGLLKAIAADSQ